MKVLDEVTEMIKQGMSAHFIANYDGYSEAQFIRQVNNWLHDKPTVREQMTEVGFIYWDMQMMAKHAKDGTKPIRIDLRVTEEGVLVRGHEQVESLFLRRYLEKIRDPRIGAPM